MTKSLPSKKISVVNAPEVSGFNAQFNYDFFVPDERTNDTGQTAPRFITRRPSEAFDSSFVSSKNFQDKVPRYVKLTWRPVIGQDDFIAIRTSIANNFDKIHNEQNFALSDYSNIDFQDTGADQRLSFFIRRALEEVQRGFAPPTSPESPLDVARALNGLTTSRLRGSFLASILTNLRDLGVTFVTKQNRESLVSSLVSQIKNSKTRFQFNNRVIAKILASATENPTGLFEDEAAILLNEATQRQSESVASDNASVLTDNEYDLEIMEYIGIRNLDSSANFNSTVEPVGYIIDKQELLDNGTLIDRSPIIVENPLANTTVDFKIKYGAKYHYRIRSVVYIEVSAQDQETGGLIAISFLVCSQDSSKKIVDCTEFVPPPPPSDFNIAWDYVNTCARVTWAFPPNSQRDIKYFQLFRRKSIDVPFELVKQFDFDDSVVRTPTNESPDPVLVERMNSPKTYYLDQEFGKDSKYIYALCSVDAHAMSSNYSMQLEVSFDKYKNRIVKSLTSVAGAPKAYPNMYLNRDTFVDTIRDSGHSRMHVVFNPEYLQVLDARNNDLKLLKTGPDAIYKLSLINVDLESQKTVTIKLEDKRTTEDQNVDGIVDLT